MSKMGCIWNKIPMTNDDLGSTVLLQGSGVLCTIKKKNTPSSYLINTPVSVYELPRFALRFYMCVQNDLYVKVTQNAYKDLYYMGDHVVSVEHCTEVNFKDRAKLFKRMKQMKWKGNILIPSNICFVPTSAAKGVVLQKMKYCRFGDMFDYMDNRLGAKDIDIHDFVFKMASTLKELHQNDIFLTDIKLENILYDDTFYFADVEYAFIDKPFLDEPGENDIITHIVDFRNSGRKWVRTLNYATSNTFPYTRGMAVQNDVFAMARCIGMLISTNYFNVSLKMFHGDSTLKVYDQRDKLRKRMPDLLDHPYVNECCEIILSHGKKDFAKFLDTLIEIYYKNKV